jgi:hypothetical protein
MGQSILPLVFLYGQVSRTRLGVVAGILLLAKVVVSVSDGLSSAHGRCQCRSSRARRSGAAGHVLAWTELMPHQPGTAALLKEHRTLMKLLGLPRF